MNKILNELCTMLNSNFDVVFSSINDEEGGLLGKYFQYEVLFPANNKQLENSKYLYTAENSFLHFTSLRALYSIINDGALRLYNLDNSNDETEYEFAADILRKVYSLQKINYEKINDHFSFIKNNSFVLSCTSPNNLNNKELWEKYGDNGEGVAIEFEIINKVNTWENFMFSEVFYGCNDHFNALIKGWNELIKKNKNIGYFINLDQFMSIHKSKGWKGEKEIRILTGYFDKYMDIKQFEKMIFIDFKKEKQIKEIKYFKLPLCDSRGNFVETCFNKDNYHNSFCNNMPKVRMSDIHFGPKIKNDKIFHKLQENLKYYIADKLNVLILNIPKQPVSIQ